MLDLQMLKAMPNNTIFATGTAMDVSDGLFMANTGKELRWVAVSGRGYHDWAIYCHFTERGIEWIRDSGDKVHGEKHIKMLVPCDNEAYAMYRR